MGENSVIEKWNFIPTIKFNFKVVQLLENRSSKTENKFMKTLPFKLNHKYLFYVKIQGRNVCTILTDYFERT